MNSSPTSTPFLRLLVLTPVYPPPLPPPLCSASSFWHQCTPRPLPPHPRFDTSVPPRPLPPVVFPLASWIRRQSIAPPPPPPPFRLSESGYDANYVCIPPPSSVSPFYGTSVNQPLPPQPPQLFSSPEYDAIMCVRLSYQKSKRYWPRIFFDFFKKLMYQKSGMIQT